MRKGGTGNKGGATTKTGLLFEKNTKLEDALEAKNLLVKSRKVFHNNIEVAELCEKNYFYNNFLKKFDIDWKTIIGRKLLPDEAIYVYKKNKLTIIEKKYQQVAGSVDEKLQTSGFKLQQYRKLLKSTNIKVNFVYVLNEWFRNPAYQDVLDYIIQVDCKYYFNEIPLQELGLN